MLGSMTKTPKPESDNPMWVRLKKALENGIKLGKFKNPTDAGRILKEAEKWGSMTTWSTWRDRFIERPDFKPEFDSVLAFADLAEVRAIWIWTGEGQFTLTPNYGLSDNQQTALRSLDNVNAAEMTFIRDSLREELKKQDGVELPVKTWKRRVDELLAEARKPGK